MAGWIIQAIEKEAEAQALKRVFETKDFRMFGLSIRQIDALIKHYRQTTGKQAHEVCEP